jgi:predicted Ser/Thr protein kinase
MIARLAIRRERRAYERLRGVAGIPELLATVGSSGLLLQFVDAVPINEARLQNPGELESRFEQLLALMHRRGVSHGEIRQAHILVDGSGSPWLIDFGTATVTDPAKPSWLFRLQRRLDRYGWLQLKECLLCLDLSQAEREEQRRTRLLAGLLRRNVI